MQRRNNHQHQTPAAGRHEYPLPNEISRQEKEDAAAAHHEAEKDMEQDPDLQAPGPNDDLDEGESARLGENNTGLV